MATAGGQSGGRAGRADATSNRKKKSTPAKPGEGLAEAPGGGVCGAVRAPTV